MTKIAQRDAFWNKVYEMARADSNVIIVSADMGAPSLDRIRREIPSQFVNAGIAEQNAIVLGAGLAAAGKKVFVYAIAPFITLRCLEQIRVENAIMKIPITIVGVGAGFGYDDSGPTHHLLEDVAALRSMPHIKIHSVTDAVMSAALAKIVCGSSSTNYIRLCRQDLPEIYKTGTDFTKGLEVLKSHKRNYIVASGHMTHTAISVARFVDAGVIDMYTLPVNKKEFIKAVGGASRILTLEETFLPGGMGSAVLETLSDVGVRAEVKRLGPSHEKGYCYKYGGLDVIHRYYGISVPDVAKAAAGFFKKR
jgi:transketolase